MKLLHTNIELNGMHLEAQGLITPNLTNWEFEATELNIGKEVKFLTLTGSGLAVGYIQGAVKVQGEFAYVITLSKNPKSMKLKNGRTYVVRPVNIIL